MRVLRDIQALSLRNRDQSCNVPPSTEALRPKHNVSEGLMTLAEDDMPEANLLIGLG